MHSVIVNLVAMETITERSTRKNESIYMGAQLRSGVVSLGDESKICQFTQINIENNKTFEIIQVNLKGIRFNF